MSKKITFIIILFLMILLCIMGTTNASSKIISNDELSTIKLENKILIAGFSYNQKLSDVLSEFSSEYTIKFFNKNGEEITDLNNKIATGKIIKIYTKSSNELKKEYTTVLYGDLDGDGTANALDALIVIKNKLKVLDTELTEAEKEAGRISADARDNGAVPSSVDALGIVKYKLMSEQYPISQKPSKNSVQDVEEEEIEQAEIYAKLYDDGTLAFTATDRVLEGKTLVEDYGRVEEYYWNINSGTCYPKWCRNKSIISVDIVDKIQPTTTAYWFYDLCELTEIKNINNLDTSIVIDMRLMFAQESYGYSSLTNIDFNGFNTSKVMYMYEMFKGCTNLITLDLSSFNTKNVTSMQGMFSNCWSLKNIDLNNWDTSNVTNMGQMFASCKKLTNINLDNFNTSNVENMTGMFRGCCSLKNIDLNNFDTTNVSSMNMMFYQNTLLTNINLSSFNTTNVEDMSEMFFGCSSLTNVDLSNFDTSNVNDMRHMFDSCTSLTSLDLTIFDTCNVQSMRGMFRYCLNLTVLNLCNFDTHKVTDMSLIFCDCGELDEILVSKSKWNLDKLQSSIDMFANCGTDHVTYIEDKT